MRLNKPKQTLSDLMVELDSVFVDLKRLPELKELVLVEVEDLLSIMKQKKLELEERIKVQDLHDGG